jgi:16S rRNA (guanine527-N7)-methyltransferase
MTVENKNSALWNRFFTEEKLTEMQLDQFKQYYELLIDWNTRINLTRITELSDAIDYHFQDSLRLGDALPLESIRSLADIGAGAGFPSIPLKIKYPHLSLVLIEVSGKRILFLQEVIKQLGLTNIEISSLDWRTFLRQTDYAIDYFCARASLAVSELLHYCKPSCRYRSSGLVYWASDEWEPTSRETKLIKSEYPYSIGTKKRKLVVFSCFECII